MYGGTKNTVLFGQFYLLYLSVSFVLHTLGSILLVSHCRFMLACMANTSVRCLFGNEHVIKEKKKKILFFSFFSLLNS